MPQRNRPRCFRYPLTTLIALMFVVALAASAYGNRLRARQRQAEVFHQTSKKGGEILAYQGGTSIHFNRPGGFICGTGLMARIAPQGDPSSFADSDVGLFDDILKLRYVNFTGTKVSEGQMHSFRTAHPKCRVALLGGEP